ncbi:MAG: hypothetical protein J4F36_04040 [Nitrosopumilaceae archaeon]|nr:hypothetical protein [Nitrosopumilaceae archaeon]
MEIEDDFIRIHTTGKTGPKSLTLVSSFGPIRDWLSEHPYSDDPNAFLFYHNNDDGLITYQAFSNMIKKAHKIAGLKKRVWGYLFRHTALTEYSKKIGNVAKIYGNWSKGSNMLAHYEHLANSDQEDAVLKLHNLKKDEPQESILFSKICTSCKSRNTSDQSYCMKCDNVLSKQLAKIREARKESRNSDVKKTGTKSI